MLCISTMHSKCASYWICSSNLYFGRISICGVVDAAVLSENEKLESPDFFQNTTLGL